MLADKEPGSLKPKLFISYEISFQKKAGLVPVGAVWRKFILYIFSTLCVTLELLELWKKSDRDVQWVQ